MKIRSTFITANLISSISDEKYDKFYESFTTQKDDISLRLSQLQEAEDNYYVTAKYVLELTKYAYDLFTRSEVEERRQLITLVLQNVRLDGKKIVYEAQKPLDEIINATSRNLWRQTRGALRTFRWINMRERLPLRKKI